MVYLKKIKKILLTLVVIVLGLVLLTEPAFAKKGSKGGAKSSGGSKSRQPAAKAKSSRSRNVSRSRPSRSAPSRVSKSRASSPKPRSNSGGSRSSRSVRSGTRSSGSSTRVYKPRSGGSSRSRVSRSVSVSKPRSSGGSRSKVTRSVSVSKPRSRVSSSVSKPSRKVTVAPRTSSRNRSVQSSSPRTTITRSVSSTNVRTSGNSSRTNESSRSRIGQSIKVQRSASVSNRSRSRNKPVKKESSPKVESNRTKIGRSIKVQRNAPIENRRQRRQNPVNQNRTTRLSANESGSDGSALKPRTERRQTSVNTGSRDRRNRSTRENRTRTRDRSSDSVSLLSTDGTRNRVSRSDGSGTGRRSMFRGSERASGHVRRSAERTRSGSGNHLSDNTRQVLREHRSRRWRERSHSRRRYRERSHVSTNYHNRDLVYIDSRDHVYHRSTWPSYSFRLSYSWGSYHTYSHFYPWYHRKYVFVSLGGYWPSHYRYSRYYWYGYHPYYWYGYSPVAREVVSDNYNYYTYNYYGDDYATSNYGYDTSAYPVVDHTTFADVREKLAQEAEGPQEPTLADKFFEEGVTCFEEGEYMTAAEAFAKAMELEPDDMILPFAYCQAMFAAGKYSQAAEALREVLAKVTPEEEGIFYPRGLYSDEELLFDQIAQLAEKADTYSFDGDLQLLLGYNLLGIGQLDEAVEPLRLAGMDLNNAPSAAVLLNMVEKKRIAEEAKAIELKSNYTDLD